MATTRSDVRSVSPAEGLIHGELHGGESLEQFCVEGKTFLGTTSNLESADLSTDLLEMFDCRVGILMAVDCHEAIAYLRQPTPNRSEALAAPGHTAQTLELAERGVTVVECDKGGSEFGSHCRKTIDRPRSTTVHDQRTTHDQARTESFGNAWDIANSSPDY